MACLRPLQKFIPQNTQLIAEPPIHEHLSAAVPPLPISRRERRNRKTIPVEDYLSTPDELKYYDLVEGKGPVAEKGSTVQVHFDCLYRGITAVSSRESKLLAGNRSIAQRTVIVPPEAGYGPKGMNEIPPGADFELNIELWKYYHPKINDKTLIKSFIHEQFDSFTLEDEQDKTSIRSYMYILMF
ncbi:peptidylprolyl isomerase [Salvia divinorum]|uniref:peptidylprolyl isomerase n=1 Tax=Salvia divinorum TaxID=28513 RepID=A0ABD1FRI6_SALDI